MGKILRLAIISSHPIQYSTPLYRRLTEEPGIDVTVLYCSRQGLDGYYDPGFGKNIRWDTPLLDGYRSVFVPNARQSDAVTGFWSLLNIQLWWMLDRRCYDAVWIHGYSYVADLIAVAAARFRRIPILYRSESSLTFDRRIRRPLWLRLVKTAFLRLLFQQVSAFLTIGTLNSEFYLRYGADAKRMFFVPYAIDNHRFAAETDASKQKAVSVRRQLGIRADAIVFFFAAKMTSQKRPMELLSAYSAIQRISAPTALVVAGDGPLLDKAKEFVRSEGLNDVHFVGFQNQTSLPLYYAACDVFVRPDGIYHGDWGLTVNEAMAAGLAIIATDAIGATIDLIRTGENGIVIQFNDQPALAGALRWMALHPEECRRMQARSREMIQQWGYTECVQGIREALQVVTGTAAN